MRSFMKRYYSHFTFIYPDIYLKNYIVEMDLDNHIIRYFPFEREIEKTEFYSGVLAFVPKYCSILPNLYCNKDSMQWSSELNIIPVLSDITFNIYNENNIKVN